MTRHNKTETWSQLLDNLNGNVNEKKILRYFFDVAIRERWKSTHLKWIIKLFLFRIGIYGIPPLYFLLLWIFIVMCANYLFLVCVPFSFVAVVVVVVWICVSSLRSSLNEWGRNCFFFHDCSSGVVGQTYVYIWLFVCWLVGRS